MNGKHFAVIAGILAMGVLTLLYGLWWSSGDEAIAKPGPVDQSTVQSDPAHPAMAPASTPAGETDDEIEALFPTPDDWLDVMEFHRDDYAWGVRERSEYSRYTQEQLEELAEAGDLRAIKELAYRYRDLARGKPVADMTFESDPPGPDGFVSAERGAEMRRMREKFYEYADLAIVHGDRELIVYSRQHMDAHTLRAQLGDKLPDEVSAAELRAAIIDALAHIEFLGLRGMQDDRATQMYGFFGAYGRHLHPNQLTGGDWNAVRQRAQEVYDQWEQQRFELGLGPFDNSVPDGKAQEVAWGEALVLDMMEEDLSFRPPY